MIGPGSDKKVKVPVGTVQLLNFFSENSLSGDTFLEDQLTDQFMYFNFSYLVIFRADQSKKHPVPGVNKKPFAW